MSDLDDSFETESSDYDDEIESDTNRSLEGAQESSDQDGLQAIQVGRAKRVLPTTAVQEIQQQLIQG